MTARAERRRTRTLVGAGVALVLVLAAAGLTALGANTVINSTEGQVVQSDERPVTALPQTDNAALAVVDDEGRLTSLVVATLLPSGEGGSIVTIPVDADASIGLGDERRPLDQLLDPAAPEAFFEAVEETLAIALQFGEIVGADRLTELIGPVGPVSVDLPFVPLPDIAADADVVAPADGPDITEPIGSDTAPTEDDAVPDGDGDGDGGGGDESESADETGQSGDDDADENGDADAGANADAEEEPPATTLPEPVVVDEVTELLLSTEFDSAAVAAVLRTTPGPGSNADRQMNDIAVWSALAESAPIAIDVDLPVDDFGIPVPATSLDEVFGRLWQGTVQVRDLAVDSTELSGDEASSVSILNRFDSLLVFAQISPARVSTPNEGLVFRLSVPITDGQIAVDGSPFANRSDVARSALTQLLFLQGNVTSVDTTPNPEGAPTVTRVEVANEQFISGLESDISDVFGETEFVVSDGVIDGVDVVLTLGTGYLDVYLGDASASSASDADTVDTDG